MNDHMMILAALSCAGFVLGWIGSEAYSFYRDSKDRRWK